MAEGEAPGRMEGPPSGGSPGLSPDDIVVALRIGGQLTGPVLLVCGREAICRPVFGRLIRLPSLPRLTGTLLLAYIGGFDAAGQSPYQSEPLLNPRFDEALFFDYHGGGSTARTRFERTAYWAILRKMTAIGMISGRGVPST